MTDKPTTAECIAAQSTAIMRDQPEITNAVCAQLLAAQEMAKALNKMSNKVFADYAAIDEALTAWRSAGGQ